MAKTLTVKRKGYWRKGKWIEPTTFQIKDKGAPGRTPKKERWFAPSVTMNWTKDMPVRERRENALIAHGNNYLSTARALQALANVTTDKDTKFEARKDAKYFFRLHRIEGD